MTLLLAANAPFTMLGMVPLPRERRRINVAAVRDAGFSPAKRGRGTAEGGGEGVARFVQGGI